MVPHEAPPASLPVRAVRGFGRWLKVAVPVLAVLYVVPLLVIAWTSASISTGVARGFSYGNTMNKYVKSEAAAPFGVTPDPTITMEAAGKAFFALQPADAKLGRFTARADVAHPDAPWRHWSLDKSMFAGASTGAFWRGPRSDQLLPLVPRGFAAQERAVLREVGMAPVWREYDLVARAPAADLIGGRFALPFRDDATWMEFPITRFASTKELAYASVMRAAWHLSEGRRDSAEAALRSTISFGRTLSVNSTFVLDQLVGIVITGIGRDALQQFYEITHDPRAAAVAAAGDKKLESTPPAVRDKLMRVMRVAVGQVDETRQAMIDVAADPSLPRGIRFESLTGLSVTTCMRTGDILFGPGRSVRDGFAMARTSLARTDGERALVDLIERTLDRAIPVAGTFAGSRDALYRAYEFLGQVYPRRVPNCAFVAASAGTILQ